MFLKECFEKVNFEKSQQMTKNHEKLPSMPDLSEQSDLYLFSLTMVFLDNLCKQFGPRSGPTKCLEPSCLTLIVFLKEHFERVNFEKSQQTTKNHE